MFFNKTEAEQLKPLVLNDLDCQLILHLPFTQNLIN
jgi:hypothetical protein